MDETDERPRGILSPADRRFLRGEADLQSEQSVYDVRYRIRQRLRNALLDFSLLFECLDDRDREQVFDQREDGDGDLTEAIVDAVAVLALGTVDFEPSREVLFVEGLQRAERRRTGGQPTAHVEVGAADRDRLAGIVETIESGRLHELSDAELRAFAHLCGDDCDRAPRDALSAVFDEEE